MSGLRGRRPWEHRRAQLSILCSPLLGLRCLRYPNSFCLRLGLCTAFSQLSTGRRWNSGLRLDRGKTNLWHDPGNRGRLLADLSRNLDAAGNACRPSCYLAVFTRDVCRPNVQTLSCFLRPSCSASYHFNCQIGLPIPSGMAIRWGGHHFLKASTLKIQRSCPLRCDQPSSRPLRNWCSRVKCGSLALVHGSLSRCPVGTHRWWRRVARPGDWRRNPVHLLQRNPRPSDPRPDADAPLA
mmetsp:Transcript_82027/g.187718  ORF Transcript_82027/g.187718 Transcript_82027/m.187718 type:complete len:239 (-) Transcript_82027:210-926(-)